MPEPGRRGLTVNQVLYAKHGGSNPSLPTFNKCLLGGIGRRARLRVWSSGESSSLSGGTYRSFLYVYNMNMKEDILRLRKLGYTYNRIREELGCSMSTISYHCGVGQKQKNRDRCFKRYEAKKKTEKSTRRYLRELAWRYKKLKGCIDCGNKDPRTLDYDHVRGVKENNVSYMWKWSYSVMKLKKEIRKCDIRCANCHRIKTYIAQTSTHQG